MALTKSRRLHQHRLGAQGFCKLFHRGRVLPHVQSMRVENRTNRFGREHALRRPGHGIQHGKTLGSPLFLGQRARQVPQAAGRRVRSGQERNRIERKHRMHGAQAGPQHLTGSQLAIDRGLLDVWRLHQRAGSMHSDGHLAIGARAHILRELAQVLYVKAGVGVASCQVPFGLCPGQGGQQAGGNNGASQQPAGMMKKSSRALLGVFVKRHRSLCDSVSTKDLNWVPSASTNAPLSCIHAPKPKG